MRVNHTGEVCAQALYQGQALTAKTAGTRTEMQEAAQEEIDHLVWCEERLDELGARPSALNPIFYGASLAMERRRIVRDREPGLRARNRRAGSQPSAQPFESPA